MAPTRALVLAAGFGTRLQPLTLEVPKCLLPVWNVPMLARALHLLRGWGVQEAVVNLHAMAPAIFDFVRARPWDGLRVSLSYEPGILGTGGAVRRAGWLASDGKPYWIVNADVYARLDPRPLLRDFARHKPLAVLWMEPRRGPRTVAVDASGAVTDFLAPRPGGAGTCTFTGLHLVSPRLLRYLPEGRSSIIDAYVEAMRAGEAVRGVPVPGSTWADVGTPTSFLEVHRHLAPARDRDRSAMGRGARAGRGARVRRSVVLDNARIAAGAHVHDAVVGPGAEVGGAVTGLVVRAAAAGIPDLDVALRALGWPARRCFVEAMGPRGSDRTFARLGCGARRAILVRYGLERRENALYVANAGILAAAGVRVPAVRFDDPRRRLTVLEDCGRTALGDVVREGPARRAHALYRDALRQLARLHTAGTRVAQARRARLCDPFTGKLFGWEHELFRKYFLAGRLGLTPAAQAAAIGELNAVAAALVREPRVLVHRDFQSSNLLVHGNGTVFIDFQGMRYGPAVYDLASLLYDPYVELSPDAQDDLLAFYAPADGRPAAALRQSLRFAAVQRLVQAVGAFGRLGTLPGTRGFLRHIPAGLRMLQRAAEGLPGLHRFGMMLAEWQQAVESGERGR